MLLNVVLQKDEIDNQLREPLEKVDISYLQVATVRESFLAMQALMVFLVSLHMSIELIVGRKVFVANGASMLFLVGEVRRTMAVEN